MSKSVRLVRTKNREYNFSEKPIVSFVEDLRFFHGKCLQMFIRSFRAANN